MIAVHQAQGQSIEFVKLVSLIIFAQYLCRYGITSIEQLVVVENIQKSKESPIPNQTVQQIAGHLEMEATLLQFKIFQVFRILYYISRNSV